MGEEKPEDKGVCCMALRASFPVLSVWSVHPYMAVLPGGTLLFPLVLEDSEPKIAWALGGEKPTSPEACHLSEGCHGLKKQANTTDHQKLISDGFTR